MQKARAAFGMAVIAMSSVLSAANSIRTYTGSGSLIVSMPLVSINKIAFDDYSMYIDTGSSHEILQRAISGGAGKVKAIFTTEVNIQRPWINGSGAGKPILANRSSGAILCFSLASAGFMSAAVYTSKGEQVREIASSRLGAGAHMLRWDGADASGTSSAPGIYHIFASVDRNPAFHATIIIP
jgi:hypothetical protein